MTYVMSGDNNTDVDVYYYQEHVSGAGSGETNTFENTSEGEGEGGDGKSRKSVAKEENSFTSNPVGKALVYTYDVLNQGATEINNFIGLNDGLSFITAMYNGKDIFGMILVELKQH